jgi:hypothetical protein
MHIHLTRRRLAILVAAPCCALVGLTVPSTSNAAGPAAVHGVVGTLVAATSLSADDMWAVGSRPRNHFKEFGAFTVHWDGSKWTQQILDVTHFSTLDGVDAAASDDVWAVGSRRPETKPMPLIEHWDGTDWSVVETSNPPARGELHDVQVVASNDAWAVGRGGKVAMIEHWKGDKWSRIKNPVLGELRSVDGSSASDIWAVGSKDRGRDFEPVVEHFDGSTWRQDKSFINPVPGNETYPTAVVSNSPTDAWVFGWYADNHSGGDSKMLIEHWDGTAWKLLKGPSGIGRDFSLNDAAGTSSSDIWAVGSYERHVNAFHLIIHWDGTRWTRVVDLRGDNTLLGVTADSPTDAWAVSKFDKFAEIEHWDGASWN